MKDRATRCSDIGAQQLISTPNKSNSKTLTEKNNRVRPSESCAPEVRGMFQLLILEVFLLFRATQGRELVGLATGAIGLAPARARARSGALMKGLS